MNSKLKQSIAVQRQIPEHIRENYPLFVEFIKLYYDYLQQTQAQDLEGVRDIDTTLEEFIGKFKSELSNNLPIDMAQDKRFLIKHLKEFYLSRGSESSFKFLFRTLFSKEAELFYPSTEILRVSDGRWKQDVSIFVQVTGSTTTLFPLNDKYIKITTSRKTITTYVENVTEYTNTTFEIFIQRDYVNEIEVGSKVLFIDDNGVNYTGIILQCPSKISIYKAGYGFTAGQLYALKTSIGRGCVIKITKVGSLGEIKAIQVVSFGLDYKSKFYSYLSNKDIGAYEYVHPAQLNHTYVPGESAYNERSGGFVDYGFASKQTYFYYDDTIPVGTPDFASDRFFADPSYVGEIVQQFYTDQTDKAIDDSLAIIEVSLGAVAKYPGYYMTANGFISDQMFIHDGKYYQAFSYVIKVEEELRKYADILKTLIHPAGMKMYAEYNIFKELKVSLIQKSLYKLLEFSDNANLGDSGYNYTSYTGSFYGVFEDVVIDNVTYQKPVIDYQSTNSANIVYSNQGKAALFSTKFIVEVINEFESINKLIEKPLSDNVTYAEALSKLVLKTFDDQTGTILEGGFNYDAYTLSLVNQQIISTPSGNIVYSNVGSTAQFIAKTILENILNVEVINKLLEKQLEDQPVSVPDAPSNFVQKPFDDQTGSILGDIDNKSVQKTINEINTLLDSSSSFVQKPFDDVLNYQTETYSNSIAKTLSELMNLITDSNTNEVIKNLIEFLSLTESIINFIEKSLSDSNTPIDALNSVVQKPLEDQPVSVPDAPSNFVQKPFDDQTGSILDNISSKFIEKPFNDQTGAIIDALINSVQKTLNELIDVSLDIIKNSTNKTITEDVINNITDSIEISRSVFFDDIASLLDSLTNALTKSFDETTLSATAVETSFVKEPIKNQNDSITAITNGRVNLSPYNSGFYFQLFSDYQPSTIIS
jgi:hypothetical protein